MNSFKYFFTVSIYDIDAAGVMFFAHLYRHAHDAYEKFMADNGFSLPELIRQNTPLPIIHSEADFLLPMRHGDKVCVHLQIKKLGNSSFTVVYSFEDEQGRQLASARTTHVLLDANHKSLALPQDLRDKLAIFLMEKSSA